MCMLTSPSDQITAVRPLAVSVVAAYLKRYILHEKKLQTNPGECIAQERCPIHCPSPCTTCDHSEQLRRPKMPIHRGYGFLAGDGSSPRMTSAMPVSRLSIRVAISFTVVSMSETTR